MNFRPTIFFLAALLLLSAATRSDAARWRVLVVKTRDIPFYDATLQGFTHGLKTRGDGDSVDYDVIALTGDSDKDQRTVREHIARGTRLIFTLGTDATRTVAAAHPACPVIFSMILDPVTLGVVKSQAQPGGSFTGTTLLVNPGKQLDALQQVMPKIQRVGVLYTDGDATSLAFLDQARQDAKRLGIEIVAKPVGPAKDAGRKALEDLAGQVNTFWLILDPASAGAQALTDTLDVARKHHLPVLGTSRANVHAGALLALSANLGDLGDVCAEMAVPLLDGSGSAAQTPVRGPRQTLLSVNLVAAGDIGLTLPDSVLHLADDVVDSSTAAEGK